MVKDYGFDIADKRRVWVLTDESTLELWIMRNYHEPKNDFEDEHDLNFDIYFKLVAIPADATTLGLVMVFPKNKDESSCAQAVQSLYESDIDDEATEEQRRSDAETARAIRMGW